MMHRIKFRGGTAGQISKTSTLERNELVVDDGALKVSDGQRPVGSLPALAKRARARTAINGGKLKGGNITVKPNAGSWQGLWSEWDWANWIQPQVDRAIDLGLNSVRVLGAPEVTINPATIPAKISQDVYDSHWRQLADYTAEKGMRLYPALAEKWAFTGWTGAPNNFQDPTAIAAIVTTAAALAEYENVIGFDIFQEGSGVLDGLVLADVLALYAAIRTVAPGVPLTTSSSSGGFGSTPGFWTDAASLPYQVWMADGGANFVDLHVYLEGVNVAQLDGFIERTGMPVLIGEFGADQTLPAASQLARYRSARVLHNRPGVLGSFVWALADQGTTDDKKIGVQDNTGFTQGTWPTSPSTSPLSITAGRRTALAAELRKFGTAELPAQVQSRQASVIPADVSRPVDSTRGWLQGTNAYLFADSRGLGIGPVAASVGAPGNVVASMSPSVPVLPSTRYKIEAEALTKVAGRTIAAFINWYDASGTYISTSQDVTAVSLGAEASNLATRISGCPPNASPANAAFGSIGFRMYAATATSEWMIVLANPRIYCGPI